VELLLTNIIPSVVTLLLGWLFGRRQQTAQVKTTELDNVEKAIKIWREMSADLEAKLNTHIESNNALIQRNNELEAEIRLLRKDIEVIINNCPNNCPVPTKIKRTTKR